MENRFRLKSKHVSYGDYGMFKSIEFILEIRVPYKFFGKIKTHWIPVLCMDKHEFLKNNIIIKTENDVILYMIECFKKERLKTKPDRILKRIYKKSK